MVQTLALVACCAALLYATVLSAPVTDKDHEGQKGKASTAAEVRDQEKDLQDLLNIVHKESHQDGVVVHKEQVSHFENNNGQKVQVEAKEEKVVDKNTGNIIADVKQEVKQESAGNGAKPETVVETKVDIPAEGVHETFVQEQEMGPDNGNEDIDESEAELTPADMAEYLYATHKVDDFYPALERLLNQSKMSAEEAEMYARAVTLEYEKLQLEDFEQRFMVERRSYPQIPQDFDAYAQEMVPDFYPHSNSGFDASDYYRYATGYMNPEENFNAQADTQDSAEDTDLYAFLAALWNEAYGKGNEEAQEIVKLMYDRVSQDDNPDDMGEIRDLLAETVAASLNQDSYKNQAAIPEVHIQEAVQKPKAEEVKPVVDVKQVSKAEQKEEKVKVHTGNKEGQQKQ